MKGRFTIIDKTVSYLMALIIISVPACRADSKLSAETKAPVSGDSGFSTRLRVQNRHIVDLMGQPVKLRGIYTRAEWLGTEQEAQWFKDWGVNFVRILLSYDRDYWKIVNDGKIDNKKRGILREENLLEMDKKLLWLEERGIYFIIEIPWQWYGIRQNLEQPELLAQQCAKMYGTLARRYNKLKYLIGFCMFSEIYIAPNLYRDYKHICTTIVDAIHDVDPTLIVSATGVRISAPDSFSFETLIDRPNVIYDFHHYDIKSFTHYRSYFGDMRYPGRVPHGFSRQSYYLDKKLNEIFISPAISFSNRYNVPIWCGEFGAFNDAPDGSSDRWMRDVCRILEQNGIPWIIWTWRKGADDVPQLWKDLWQGKIDYNEVAISPHGGTFTDELTVTIDSWKCGRIYYTLDGTEPDKSSTLYKKPFRIKTTMTIKARMICDDGTQGPVDATVFNFGGLRPAQLAKEGKPASGLQYAVYNTAAEKIEDLDLNEPESVGVTEDFNGVKLDRTENKTIVYKGLIDIKKAGRYFFFPVSYAACEIYIGDALVNKHFATKFGYARTSPGIITLEVGLHRLKVIYSKPSGFEGGFALRLQRDVTVVNPPYKVEEAMLYHTDSLQWIKTD